MIIKVVIWVEAPDGTTHYTGDIAENPTWFKVTQVGVAGDHWWYWNGIRRAWVFAGHYPPQGLQELDVEPDY